MLCYVHSHFSDIKLFLMGHIPLQLIQRMSLGSSLDLNVSTHSFLGQDVFLWVSPPGLGNLVLLK